VATAFPNLDRELVDDTSAVRQRLDVVPALEDGWGSKNFAPLVERIEPVIGAEDNPALATNLAKLACLDPASLT
jgi:hypothetical protein